jgi:hypothetical protein
VVGAAIGGAVGAGTGVAASEAAHDDHAAGNDVIVDDTTSDRRNVMVRDRAITPVRDAGAEESMLTPEERRAINVDTRR